MSKISSKSYSIISDTMLYTHQYMALPPTFKRNTCAVETAKLRESISSFKVQEFVSKKTMITFDFLPKRML